MKWKRCSFPEEVREAGRAFRRCRCRRRGACQRALLRRLSLRKVFVGRPVLVDLGDGQRESGVVLQTSSLTEWCRQRFSLPDMQQRAARQFALERDVASASSARVAARMDGVRAKAPDFWSFLQLLTSASCGSAPGKDGVVQELILKAPMGVKILLWEQFRDLLVGKLRREKEAPPSWDCLVLSGLPKDRGETWADRRWVARTSVIAKHWHRYLVHAACCRFRQLPVLTFGFQRHFRCSDVALTLSGAISLSRQYGYSLTVIEADILRCFDELDQGIVMSMLLPRGWPPEAVECMIKEYAQVRAEATVACGTVTPPFPFLLGGRTGGTETPQLLVEILQAAFAPVVAKWRAASTGFRLAGETPCMPGLAVVDLIMWADNAWFFGASDEMALAMLEDIAGVLYGVLKLRWKPSSLKILRVLPEKGSVRRTADVAWFPRYSAVPLPLVEVDSLVALGCRISVDGCSFASMEHRLMCCNLALGKHRVLLRSRDAALRDRLVAHMAVV